MRVDPSHRAVFAASLVTCLSIGLASCDSSGAGNGSIGFSSFDLLVGDHPADDLLAFRATVNEVRLQIAAGGETVNLLDGPIDIELLGLQERFAWLASEDVPTNTYSGVRLVFAPASYDARRIDGTLVAVNALSNEVTLDFATELVVSGAYRKVEVDLDLARSLVGDVSTPPLDFAPQGSVEATLDSAPIDEIKGVVSSVNGNASTLVLNASVDDDGIVPLGPVLVRLQGATILVDDDGSAFATGLSFLGALVPGSTSIEVHGDLQGGGLYATRIEIEDNLAGGGDDNLVKIEGLVIGLGPASTLEMSVVEIEKGSPIVIAAMTGMPNTLDVTWNASTVCFLGEGGATAPASLAVGQRIKAKFASFTNPPFTASRIQIESLDVLNHATITSVAGLPSTIVVHMESLSPAILAGQVSSSVTDVVVDVAGLLPALTTDAEPTFALASLLADLRIKVRGPVAGTAGSPTIDASAIEVKAGELVGADVASVSPTQQFTTSGGSIANSFGSGVSAGPQTVLTAASCVFQGDATTRAAFFALFQNLGLGEVLVVDVEGLGTGNVNEIQAYQVRASVQ